MLRPKESRPSGRETRRILIAHLLFFLTACGAGAPESDDASADDAEGTGTAAAGAQLGADVAPVVPGVVDAALAESGEGLFTTKGCTGCHTVGGGRLVGPDLVGVTERREPAWIQAMILRPDSMLQADATAMQLLGEYYTPMLPLGILPTEARAILEFLRTRTSDGSSP